MTSPEWEAANEDDSDRFPQPSPHEAPPPVVDPLRSDPARVARYAEALWRVAVTGLHEPVSTPSDWDKEARAVVAVADEERAALVAEVERLRGPFPCCKHCPEDLIHDVEPNAHDLPCTICEDTLRARVEAAEAEVERLRGERDEARRNAEHWRTEANNMLDDAHAGSDALLEMCDRVDAAESRVAKVEALADEEEAKCLQKPPLLNGTRSPAIVSVAALRAVLADAPAEQTKGGA